MPSLTQTPSTPAHDVFHTAAVSGLFGVAVLALRKLAKADQLAVLDAVKDCRASLVWTVEAEGDHATIKTEVHRPDRTPEVVAVATVSLNLVDATGGGGAVTH